jgi:hypothetical protein
MSVKSVDYLLEMIETGIAATALERFGSLTAQAKYPVAQFGHSANFNGYGYNPV